MNELFLRLVNMSIQAGWLVLAVIALRLLLRRAPRAMLCALWALVAVRLLLPFSLESTLSLQPTQATLPVEDVLSGPDFNIESGVPAVDVPVNAYLDDHYLEGVTVPAENGRNTTAVLSAVWIAGMTGMSLYTLFSYRRLRRKTAACLPHSDGVWLCDYIDSPFILGVVRPQVFLPSSLPEEAVSHVIAHEKAHLARRDHWWKPLGFALLTVYWFHPLLWAGYSLLCRDIELACDEKVIRALGADGKKGYSEALLQCSVPRRLIAACPLAFGEVSVTARIRSVLHYRKPAFWLAAAAAVAVLAAAACFLTDPVEQPRQIFYRGSAYEYNGQQIDALPTDCLEIGVLEHLLDPDRDHPVDRCGIHLPEAYLGRSLYYNGSTLFLEDDGAYLRFAREKVLVEGHTYLPYEKLYETPASSAGIVPEDLPSFDLDVYRGLRQQTDSGWSYLGHMKEIELSKDNFDRQFRSWDGAAALRRKNVLALELILRETGERWLLLEQKDGQILLGRGYYDAEGETDPHSDDSAILWLVSLLRVTAEETPYPSLFHQDHAIDRAAMNDVRLHDALRDELVRLINESARDDFPVGVNNGWTEKDKRVALGTAMAKSGVYDLHYWYHDGYFVHEGDYVSILTWYDETGSAAKAWKLDQHFDAAFEAWMAWSADGRNEAELRRRFYLTEAGRQAQAWQVFPMDDTTEYLGAVLFERDGQMQWGFLTQDDCRVRAFDQTEGQMQVPRTAVSYLGGTRFQYYTCDGQGSFLQMTLDADSTETRVQRVMPEQIPFTADDGTLYTLPELVDALQQAHGKDPHRYESVKALLVSLGDATLDYAVRRFLSEPQDFAEADVLWDVLEGLDISVLWEGSRGANDGWNNFNAWCIDILCFHQRYDLVRSAVLLERYPDAAMERMLDCWFQELQQAAASTASGTASQTYQSVRHALISWDDHTLDYIVRRFLSAPDGPAEADVLWDVASGLLGEEALFESVYVDGTTSFREWSGYILKLYHLNGEAFIAESAPKSWNVLQPYLSHFPQS